MIFAYLFYVYDIHLLNINSMDTSDESLQDTVLIKFWRFADRASQYIYLSN